MQFDQVTVIGGGLAGSECAIQLADRGFAVKLCEMRPQVSSPAHHTDHLAELVCSNSFKSTRPDSAAGLLKAELERMGSVLLDCAHRAAVPAGGALAVDRVKFSELVEAEVAARPNIEIIHGEVTQIPEGHVVIAAGPLCSPALSEEVMKLVGGDALAFFDAAAPIVDARTLSEGETLTVCADRPGSAMRPMSSCAATRPHAMRCAPQWLHRACCSPARLRYAPPWR